MGRRSINTTKSGKYMNPTDQASKLIKLLIFRKIFIILQILLILLRKGSSQKGAEEEQEAKANGEASCAEKQRSRTVIRRNGEN